MADIEFLLVESAALSASATGNAKKKARLKQPGTQAGKQIKPDM
jgi:hypothetical protein